MICRLAVGRTRLIIKFASATYFRWHLGVHITTQHVHKIFNLPAANISNAQQRAQRIPSGSSRCPDLVAARCMHAPERHSQLYYTHTCIHNHDPRCLRNCVRIDQIMHNRPTASNREHTPSHARPATARMCPCRQPCTGKKSHGFRILVCRDYILDIYTHTYIYIYMDSIDLEP